MITQKAVYDVLAATPPATLRHPRTHWVMSAASWDAVQTAFAGTFEAFEVQQPDDPTWHRRLLGIRVEIREALPEVWLVAGVVREPTA